MNNRTVLITQSTLINISFDICTNSVFVCFSFPSDTTFSFRMKFSIKNQFDQLDPKKLLKISVVLVVVGAFMSLVFVPQLVHTIVKFMTILKPGRFVRHKHEKPLPFTYKIYLWNVTNPDEVSNNQKPKLQEVGPYVFE